MDRDHTNERSCACCGRPSRWLANGLCLECLDADRGQHSRVEVLIDYVRAHPGITVAEVSRILGLPPARIYALIEAGSLSPAGAGR